MSDDSDPKADEREEQPQAAEDGEGGKGKGGKGKGGEGKAGKAAAESQAPEAQAEDGGDAEEGGKAAAAEGEGAAGEASDGEGAGGEGEDALGSLIAEMDGEVAAAPDAATGEGAEAEAAPGATTARQYLLFSLAGTRCALPLDHLLELGEMPRLTALPNVPRWVRGVTNLRGDILAVLDLPLFFEMGGDSPREVTRMLVVRNLAHTLMAGLLADEVHGISVMPEERLRAPEAPLEDKIAPYLAGVVEHDEKLVSVLDLDKLLAAPEFRQLEAM